ncbi:PLD nuclease N-terminal domain-containing protein [Alteraurantiacibacter buctensis]|uniref:Cardiolipin synthase N-terminal domain-containing protein n=1 Tax=Alteraurantiacibacter buctensis TaxID=1503981 RepID=A0A844YZ64_9SPHN|nr:PLD nuclease N-terminal domain-containing protein [Alteraurantiacibacter buctensis]MXO71377.1 hypothetical protein [Alteraurantiacibacter buctensis]
MMALAIVIFVIDLMAIINIVQSVARPPAKALWIVAVILLPVLGAGAWFLAPAPRRSSSRMR